MRLRHCFWVNILLTLFFTMLGLAVMGYHPGAEDDGIYLAAIKSDLNPSLYPRDADFFRLQLQATFFDKWIAAFVHWTGIPVAITEFFFQFATIVLIVFSCWLIARRLFKETRAQWAGVAMVTAMFTLPVAGTALYLVDQHLHPRNMATALILLAVSRVLARRKVASDSSADAGVPAASDHGRDGHLLLLLPRAGTISEPLHAWVHSWNSVEAGAVAAFVPLGWIFERPTPLWREALNTRTCFFLDRWAWYEWLGAVAPLFLFWLLWRFAKKQGETRLARFALAVFLYGVFQLAVAILMLTPAALIRLLPLQPMRFLQLVYVFMTLIGGCLLGKYLLKSSVWRWAVFLVVFNGGMFVSQRNCSPPASIWNCPDGVPPTPGCKPSRGSARTRPPTPILPLTPGTWPRPARIITASARWPSAASWPTTSRTRRW
jgi:hypothetical protein